MRVAEQSRLRFGVSRRNLANWTNLQDYHRQSGEINVRRYIFGEFSRPYRWCKRVDRVAVRNHLPQTAVPLPSRCVTFANALPPSLPKRFCAEKDASEQKRFFREQIFPMQTVRGSGDHDEPDRKSRRKYRYFASQ